MLTPLQQPTPSAPPTQRADTSPCQESLGSQIPYHASKQPLHHGSGACYSLCWYSSFRLVLEVYHALGVVLDQMGRRLQPSSRLWRVSMSSTVLFVRLLVIRWICQPSLGMLPPPQRKLRSGSSTTWKNTQS